MIRINGPIWDAWTAGGPYVGVDAQPDTRVYVERRYYGGPGDYAEGPWNLGLGFSATVNGQTNLGRSFFWQPIISPEFDYFDPPESYGDTPTLRQVPNVKSVQIDRNLDSPAATITMTIYNQEMTEATVCDVPGTPGYYTWNMGENPVAVARWNREENPWTGVLVPNALLRTYQGYGGIGMTLDEALDAGHLVCTGWWLIDEVRVGTDGMLNIKGRDMAKLLIEQRLFPFLVPQSNYPVKYQRWVTSPDDPTMMVTGNYKDYSDIVKQLLRWCGWAIFVSAGAPYEIHGSIEPTGVPGGGGATAGGGFDLNNNTMAAGGNTYTLAEDFFDKKPPIDVIQELKQIVGYNFWIDADGAARFGTPNWWSPGNTIDSTGARVEFIPEIDEQRQLTDLTVAYSDKNARTGIMIVPKLPEEGIAAEGYYQSNSQGLLSGIFKLAIWANEVFKDRWTAQVMAELINMQISRSLRVYSVSAIANPCIMIDDQVSIWERQTGSADIHYVKGIVTNHDLDSGSFTMDVATIWMGNMGDANITAQWLAENSSVNTGPVRLDNFTEVDEEGLLLNEDGQPIEDLEI